eukprot:1158261-Pelagomonas_calceolata.AAC.14
MSIWPLPRDVRSRCDLYLSVGQTFQRNFSLIMKCPLVLTLSCLAGVREWQLSDVVLCALHHDVRPHTTNVGARPAGMAASGRLSAPPARQHDRLVSWDGSSDASSDAGGESWDWPSVVMGHQRRPLDCGVSRGMGHQIVKSNRPSDCALPTAGGGEQWEVVILEDVLPFKDHHLAVWCMKGGVTSGIVLRAIPIVSH